MHNTDSQLMYVVLDKVNKKVIGIYSLIQANDECYQLNQNCAMRYEVQGPFNVNLNNKINYKNIKTSEYLAQPKFDKLETIKENTVFPFDFKDIK